MDKQNLLKIIDSFPKQKIGVIGDLMLDHFIWGEVERISPEAPVPVVLAAKESFVPGGAGNTANNVAALGARTSVVGLIGADWAGEKLKKEFEIAGIEAQGIIEDRQKPTIQKTRIVAKGQHLARVDKEDKAPIGEEQKNTIFNFIASRIKDWQGLIISDYAKGLMSSDLAQRIIALAKQQDCFVIGDVGVTGPEHTAYLENCLLIAPNYKQAKEITGKEDIKEAGRALQEQLNCNVVITQGADGMTLFNKDKISHFPAQAKKVVDVSGAGDTVVAALSLALAGGANIEQAVQISNLAAGLVVGKPGTATTSLEELRREL